MTYTSPRLREIYTVLLALYGRHPTHAEMVSLHLRLFPSFGLQATA